MKSKALTTAQKLATVRDLRKKADALERVVNQFDRRSDRMTTVAYVTKKDNKRIFDYLKKASKLTHMPPELIAQSILVVQIVKNAFENGPLRRD